MKIEKHLVQNEFLDMIIISQINEHPRLDLQDDLINGWDPPSR